MNDLNARCDNKEGKQDKDSYWCCMPHCQEEVTKRNNKKNRKFSKSDQKEKFQEES